MCEVVQLLPIRFWQMGHGGIISTLVCWWRNVPRRFIGYGFEITVLLKKEFAHNQCVPYSVKLTSLVMGLLYECNDTIFQVSMKQVGMLWYIYIYIYIYKFPKCIRNSWSVMVIISMYTCHGIYFSYIKKRHFVFSHIISQFVMVTALPRFCGRFVCYIFCPHHHYKIMTPPFV